MATEKKKTCFVIMPISNQDGYAAGHFGRVYEHLIKPACKAAGFEPIRADDIKRTNFIVVDIIQQILNADMAICDLSSRNPNVFYELGMRQAFNKPVTLIKDMQTIRAFDVQGFKDIEYDENLRVDNVGRQVEMIAEDIANTYAEKDSGNVNSIVGLLGITVAPAPARKEITQETDLILEAINDLRRKVVEVEQKELLSDKASLFGPPLLKDTTVKMISQVAQDLGVSWQDALGLIQKYIVTETSVTSWNFSSFMRWYSNQKDKVPNSNKPAE